MNVAEDATLCIDDRAKATLLKVFRDLSRIIKLSDGEHNECLGVFEVVNNLCEILLRAIKLFLGNLIDPLLAAVLTDEIE